MTALPQNMRALTVANEVRRGIRAFVGETRKLPPREAANVIADVFEHDHRDRVLGAARIRDLLSAVRWLRKENVEKLLELASCAKDPDKRLRDLTERQRVVIFAQLRLWDGQGMDL